MADNRYTNVPYLVARRGEAASFALFSNGAIRRVTGAVEYQVLTNELGCRVVEISGEEHDAMATMSKDLFGF